MPGDESAALTFEELESNADLWPPVAEDGEEVTSEQLAKLTALVQELYKLREFPPPGQSRKRYKKTLVVAVCTIG